LLPSGGAVNGITRGECKRGISLLHDLTIALGRPNAEIDIVCGYRTPWSNEYLRTHGHGVAPHSLHMQAMAIDIRVPGVPTSELRDAALGCIVVVWATTRVQTSSTSTSVVCVVGSFSYLFGYG
jgi:hypothetical protein